MDGTIEYPLLNPEELVGEAWAAMGRQDTEAGLMLWRKVREHLPERPDGYIWPIQLLWLSGRLDEADAMAGAAFARFPDDPDLLAQYAWIAMSRQRWDEALNWWAAVRQRAPERIDGYIWAVQALWQSQRLDEAETMAADALTRFPDQADALVEHAWVATSRRDWQVARERWMAVVERYPERADAPVGAIRALRMLGRIEEAEAMTREALARFPDNPELLSLAASADGGRGGLSTAELMLAFESLGERCDFGAVQRAFGAEPLGLLRFAFTKYDPLIAALEDRFAAVGTAEDTGFELYGDENILVMKKYGLVFHTFVGQNELPTAEKREAFRGQQRRRLAFLKDKLVADLEDPQKIYVYASDDHIRESDVTKLFAALRAYGPNSLLYVRPADKVHPEGTVEKLQDGLYIGYFPRLTDFVAGEQPPRELWRLLCEKTYRLSRLTGGS